MAFKTRRVVITMPDGSEKTYVSQSEASKHIGLDQSRISKLCRGKVDTISGYRARFEDADSSAVE